jgi:hypothetical protein
VSPFSDNVFSGFDAIIDTLIKTAYDPEIIGGHRAAATNTICTLIGHVQSIGMGQPLDQGRWFNLFSVVLDRSDSTKGKYMRQLLGVLVGLLSLYDMERSAEIKTKSLYLVFRILLAQSDHVKVKPAFQVLSLFFSKQIISLNIFTTQVRQFMKDDLGENLVSKSDEAVLQCFAQKLLSWMRYQDASPAAGQTFCTLFKLISRETMQVLSDETARNLEPLWIEPLMASFTMFPEARTNFKHHLLPELFTLDIPAYVKLLEIAGLHQWLASSDSSREGDGIDEAKTHLLFTALQVGKETGIVLDASM